MKYSLCVLILFFVFSFVLNKTEIQELKDGKEETIVISESDLYVGFPIYKSGNIVLTLKNKDDHKLSKEDITIGLYNSLSKDGPNYSNINDITYITNEYTFAYSFEKGDNEFLIVHIKNLTVGKNATITISFYSKMETWTIVVIVLASLLCALIIVICICKKLCCCCR